MRVAVLSVLLLAGCGSSPTTPSSTPTTSSSPSPPTPTSPAAALFRVTGVVTDETGILLTGLPLHFEYSPAGDGLSEPASRCNVYCYFTTSTDSAGRYEVRFNGVPVPFYQSSRAAGLVHTWREGYQQTIQLLPLGTTDIVQNIRLRRSRVVRAGESITSVVEPDSSMCTDLEDWFVWARKCEFLLIATETAGTLVVEGRESAGGPLPMIFFTTTGNYTTSQNIGTGVVSVGVRAGEKYTVLVGAPVDMPAQRYLVSTAIR